MRIACLHSAGSNRDVFDAALAELGRRDVSLLHVVREDLLVAAERAGALTDAVAGETAAALRALAGEADAVLLTCSTLGPSVGLVEGAATPVLRVDQALARNAVRSGGHVVALCAVATTLEPTREIFEAAIAATGLPTRLELRLVEGAWDLFRSGDRAGYLERIAAAADLAFPDGAAAVALAQASMAGAAALCRRGRPLTSPAAGLGAAIAAAGS